MKPLLIAVAIFCLLPAVALAQFQPGFVQPGSFYFQTIVNGPDPSSQTLNITISTNPQASPSWTATPTTTSGGSWLTVSPTSGSGNGSTTISVSAVGLAAGRYDGQVKVVIGSDTPILVPVTFDVASQQLKFTGAQGGSNPAGQTL